MTAFAHETDKSAVVGHLPRGWSRHLPKHLEPRAIKLTGPTNPKRHGFWLELYDTRERVTPLMLRLPPTAILRPELVPTMEVRTGPRVERHHQDYVTGRTFGGVKMIGAEYVELVGDDLENGPFERGIQWFRLDYVRVAERIFSSMHWDLDENLCLCLRADGEEQAVLAGYVPPAGTIAAIKRRKENDT